MEIWKRAIIVTFILTLGEVPALPSSKWSKRSIVVCWAANSDQDRACRHPSTEIFGRFKSEPKYSRKIKAAVQDLVKRQFSIARAGVEFVGWKQCADSNTFDAIVFLSEVESGGEASIGPCSHFASSKRNVPYVMVPFTGHRDQEDGEKLSAQEVFQFNVIHEFGHLAGLSHVTDNRTTHGAGPLAPPTNSIMSYEVFDLLDANGLRFVQSRDNRLVNPDEHMFHIQEFSEFEETVNAHITLSERDLSVLKSLFR